MFELYQASDLLQHPFLQPYVEQYRILSSTVDTSPDKPRYPSRPRVHKSMNGSRTSSVSSSDRGSLHSSEKNISGMAYSFEHKGTETDPSLTDEVVKSDDSYIQFFGEIECSPDDEADSGTATTETEELEITKPVREGDRRKSEIKQPKVKNTVVALKEDKVRETSSPVRATRLKVSHSPNQKANVEPSPRMSKPPTAKANTADAPNGPTKTNCDTVKRVQGSHLLKHLVIVISIFSR